MNWIFKINGHMYSKNIDIDTLNELKIFLENEKKKSGFIELENSLVNINLIEQICEADKYCSGAVKM